MEGSTSFNPGFLGSSFNWWIGQIADDSVWRDNILSGKYPDASQIPGWGRRYKVRIIGLHDQGEVTIPSENLPWANIMYPVTAGGGQSESMQTANLRQGNMVFGFFMDGQEMQVPVIMGVLGNNSQTNLSTTIGNNRVTDTQSGSLTTSGIARGKIAKVAERELLPDEALKTTKPGVSPETSVPTQNQIVNQYGLTKQASSSQSVRLYIEQAESLADSKSLTGEERTNFITKNINKNLKIQRQKESSPLSPAQPGATKEHVDGIHQLEVADIKRDDRYKYKIPLMKADNHVENAIKGIQTIIDNLINMIDKYLQTFQSYVEQVSNVIQNIKKEIENAANSMAKYMKVIYDKISEYITKIVNQGLTAAVSAIPSSFRHLFADVKEETAGLTYCLYNKIIKGLSGQILDSLLKTINLDELEKKAKKLVVDGKDFQTAPRVPVCYAEDIVVTTIRSTVDQVDDANNQLLNNIEVFMGELQSEISNITNEITTITDQVSEIVGSISGAMSFTNITVSVFGCDLSPSLAASDFFTLDGGGGGQSHSQLPSSEAISASSGVFETASEEETPPFALPGKDQETVIWEQY
tara:strand:- start:2068 stop:3813 length:1746 start_codon:yes stop_codon:yes gene_type:complete